MPSAPNNLAPTVLRYVAERGGDARGLAREVGLPEDADQANEVALDLDDFLRLLTRAGELLDDPVLGLHLAAAAERHRSYGLAELVARSGSTVRDAFVGMVRFGRLANDAIAFDLDEDPEEARFTHRVLGVDPDLARPINEFAVATMVLRSTEQASRAIGPRRVWFAHREAADPEAVARFFGVPVSYGRPDNGVAVAIEHLDAPLATADPRLRATAEQLAERALADHPPADDLVARIARRVEVRLGSGTASARRVAADLGMSPRTLQRRLDDHGLTWRALLDRVRVEAARVYLAESPLEVGEIALRLGFAETRAFSRAFRRWTGRSPGEYRRSPS